MSFWSELLRPEFTEFKPYKPVHGNFRVRLDANEAPPMASAPYTAEAEAASTSTRSTAINGMAFRSNAFTATLVALGATLRPLMSTSVASGPSPRISAYWPFMRWLSE